MSQVAKEDKSFSVEDNLPSKEINFGSSRVLFAHQASAGDKSIDLTNLVTPSDMGSNGFVQALSTEISAAHLSVLRNNLDLRSTRGPLIPFLDYVVTDAGTLNFLPTSVLGVEGALEGEIFVGVIDTKKANSLVVGDVKEYDVTIDDTNFTPGDTILNLGVKYKVNENSLNQTGEFRAYKNGQRVYRNVGNALASPLADGNYHEVDAGTGEGTTVELNIPAEAGDIFGFDFGLKISKGDVAIFEALERLQGSFLKLATDAAPGLGNPLSDYFTANPSEIERRAFGDKVLDLIRRMLIQESIHTERNKIQTKIMSGDHTTDAVIAELTFSNLVVGRWYEVNAQFAMEATASESAMTVEVDNGGQRLGRVFQHIRQGAGTLDEAEINLLIVGKFQASDTTLTFTGANIAGDRIVGTGTKDHTFAQLEERNDLEETADFT